MIADSDIAVRPFITHECTFHIIRLLRAEVPASADAFDIMHVHMLPDRDRRYGASDDFAVFAHVRAGLDRRNRDFMAERNIVRYGDVLNARRISVFDRLACHDFPKRRHDVIAFIHIKRVRACTDDMIHPVHLSFVSTYGHSNSRPL